MDEYISREEAVDDGYLSDWYIASVGDESPVWTDAHIDELLNDFIVIPKDTKAVDVQPLSVVAEHIKKRLYETAFDTNELIAREAITDIAERIDFWIDELKEGGIMIDAEKDMKLMTDVMSQICNYAIENGMKPTETLKTVANNILMITEISNFDGWGSKDGGTND